MSAVITQVPTIVLEQRVILHDVSWEIYEGLMESHTDKSAPRFTYFDGQMEIYMPSQKHEKISRCLELIVTTLAEGLEIDFESLGSTTFKRKDSNKGVEPDGCFYLQSYEEVFGQISIDVAAQPPDLVLEVDITSPSLDRFPLYASLGVPEIWRYQDDAVTIHLLTGSEYLSVPQSAAFPVVTAEMLTQFLTASHTVRRSVWLRSLREWVHAASAS